MRRSRYIGSLVAHLLQCWFVCTTAGRELGFLARGRQPLTAKKVDAPLAVKTVVAGQPLSVPDSTRFGSAGPSVGGCVSQLRQCRRDMSSCSRAVEYNKQVIGRYSAIIGPILRDQPLLNTLAIKANVTRKKALLSNHARRDHIGQDPMSVRTVMGARQGMPLDVANQDVYWTHYREAVTRQMAEAAQHDQHDSDVHVDVQRDLHEVCTPRQQQDLKDCVIFVDACVQQEADKKHLLRGMVVDTTNQLDSLSPGAAQDMLESMSWMLG